MQGYNDGLTSLLQDNYYAEPRLSPALAAKEEFEAFERKAVTKQIFEEGLAGVALLKQAGAILSPCTHACTWISANQEATPAALPEQAAESTSSANSEREAVTKQILEEGLNQAGVALLKQPCGSLSLCS